VRRHHPYQAPSRQDSKICHLRVVRSSASALLLAGASNSLAALVMARSLPLLASLPHIED